MRAHALRLISPDVKQDENIADEINPVTAGEMGELMWGPNQSGSMFATREALRAAWERHRTVMLAMSTTARRPLAWWEFDGREQGLTCPGDNYDRERSTLWRADVLEPEERVAIETEWFAEFQSAYARGFDAAGRRAHLKGADVPRELVRQWTAARKRSSKTIKRLAGEAKEPAAPPVT